MIDIYSQWNTDYSHNGDVTLDPMRCDFTPILNGSWEMELEAPLDSQNKFLELQAGAVIRTDTPIGKNQLFRIYDTERTSDSVIAYARPVFLDSAHDVFFVDCRPTNMAGQECLDYLMDGTPYTGKTDITISKTAYYVRKNLIEALAGNEDNSFLSRWGGEISYDNYTINIMTRLGSDNGLRAEFGRNISEITETIDTDSMATRVVPVAFNGYTLDGDEPWVDSLRINDYPIVHTKVVEFENLRMAEDVEEGSDAQGFDTLEELQAAMIDAVWDLYNAGLDTPQVTYQINLVDLRRMDAYKGYEGLEEVNLGDTVHCYHRKLGIETDARVVQYTYDCIRQRIKSITIGDYQEDYFDAINNAITSSGTIVDFDSIATEIAFIKSNYIQTNGLEAALAYIGYLSADQIMADHATIIDLEASYAQIGELEADVAYINDLIANMVTTDYLEANYARIAQLEALSVYAVDIAAQAANIESVLAGNVGTGTLQTIHLTSDNVVIQDALITNAMIANVSADKLTAGTIYTDIIKIANNEGQNLWIDGATIQITDENDIVRVQIGMDASGDYNLYLWDEWGTLIWNAYGLTEEGLTGNGAIIRDAAIADDANIQEYKIDMQSVADRLNNDGMIVVDGVNVLIDGNTLTYTLSQMEVSLNNITNLEAYGIKDLVDYFALGTTDEYPPSDPSDTSSALGEFILGYATLGGDNTSDWSRDWPEITETDEEAGLTYRWWVQQITYNDGTVAWTDPVCLSDGYVRSQTTTLVTSLEVVQGQIEAKVWLTDIIEYVDPLENEYEVIREQFTDVIQQVDSITSVVGDIEYVVGEEMEELRTQISVIKQAVDEILESVTDTYQYIDNQISIIDSRFAVVDITLDGITQTVGEVDQRITDDYNELDSRITTVTETADGLMAEVEAVSNYVSDTYISLSEQITNVYVTAEGIGADLTELTAVVDENNIEVTTKIAELQLTVDGFSLSFSSIESELGNSLLQLVDYYALGTSDTEPPSEPSNTSSELGEFILGEAILGGDNTSDWSTEVPENPDGLYLWYSQQRTYQDGTVEWSEPVCLTDGWARTQLVSYGSSLDVLEQSIEAKVWMNDIETAVNSATGEMVTFVEEKYSDIYIDIDGITEEVRDYMTVTTDNINGVIDRVGKIEVRVDEIDLVVSDVQTWQTNFRVGGTNFVEDSEDREATRLNVSNNYMPELILDISDYGQSQIQDTDNTHFTLSFDYEISGVTTSCSVNPSIRGVSGGSTSYITGVTDDIDLSVGDNSGHYSCTFALSATSNIRALGDRIRFTNFGAGDNYGTVVHIKHMQLEVGTEETDWSPAPEDINTFITEAKEAAIQITEDSITSYVNDTFTYQSDFLTYTQENDARIEILDSSITSTVSSVSLIESKYTKYGTCDTEEGTRAKVATVDGFDSDCLVEGSVVVIRFDNANTASNPTLNVNGTGAHLIMGGGTSLASTNSRYWWSARACITFVYRNRYWHIVDSDATSKITQLADSITLEVTSSSNGTASIVLSADGSQAGSLTAVTGARKAFENENNTTCTVTSGTITFSSNTIVIDSDYFTVSERGVITATSGTIGGWTMTDSTIQSQMIVSGTQYDVFISGPGSAGSTALAFSVLVSTSSTYSYEWYVRYDGYMYANNVDVRGTITTEGGDRKTVLTQGGLDYYYNSYKIGTFSGAKLSGYADNITGISMIGTYALCTFIGIGRYNYDSSTEFTFSYLIDYTNGQYTSYIHNFYGTVHMNSTLTMDRQIYLSNSYGIRLYKTDGSYVAAFYMSDSDRIHIGDSSSSNKCVTFLHGEMCLDNGYALEGLNPSGDTRRYLLCITDQDNVVVGSANSPLYLRGDGVYLYGTTTAVTSDRRLKCDIADLDGSYDTVFDSLAPIEYRYRMGGGIHLGFTTQDMQAALTAGGKDYTDYAMLSTCLNEEDSTWYGALAYDEIIALLVYELQKTKKEVAELRAAAGMEDSQ